jgi:hypothetical protein
MRASPNNVIIFFSEEERRKIFEKPIKGQNGETVWLAVSVMAEENEDGAGERTVTVGKIVAVGNNVTGIKAGDDAVVDYMVDLDDKYIISADEKGKFVSINAVTTQHTEDHIIDANRRTPHPTTVYSKGDYNEISLLIGIVSDGVIKPNRPYILLEHVEEEWKESETGLLLIERPVAVKRKVISVYEGSTHTPDEQIVVEEEAIFTREINGLTFDVVFETDILMSEKEAETVSDSLTEYLKLKKDTNLAKSIN